MTQIEFLTDDVESDAGDELWSPPERRRPRRMIAGAMLLATAVVLALDSRHGEPLLTGGVSDAYTGAELQHVLRGPAAHRPTLAVAIVGETTWVAQRDGLRIVTASGRTVRRAVPANTTRAQLVADPDGSLVWLVTNDTAFAYSARTLRVVGAASAPPATALAAWHDRLFLARGPSLVQLTPDGAAARTVLTVWANLVSVAADPVRDRLLVADDRWPADVLALVPDGAGVRIAEESTVNVAGATLGVAGGRIWLAGSDTGAGVLVRLDPGTLRAEPSDQPAGVLEPGASVIAAGGLTLWLRRSEPDGQVRCYDATNGQEQQSWLLDGPVASTYGRAVIGTARGALQLDLHLCAG